MTQPLYQITHQAMELRNLADADPEMEIAVADTLEAIEMEFEDKAVAVARICLNLKADVEAIKKEIARLQGRKKVVENRQASLVDYLRVNMEKVAEANNTKVKPILKDPAIPIRYRMGSESVIVDDNELIPDEFVRVPEVVAEADKKKIMDDYRASDRVCNVPGVHIERGKASIKIG